MNLGDLLDRAAGAKPYNGSAKTESESTKASQKASAQTFALTKFLAIALVIGVSFYLGAAYQKSRQPTTMALGTNGSSQQQFGGGGPGGGGFGRGVGISTSQVTAISSTSITTKDSSGNSNTYGINTNTLISDSGQQVDTSDISTGDTVIVIPSRIDTVAWPECATKTGILRLPDGTA